MAHEYQTKTGHLSSMLKPYNTYIESTEAKVETSPVS